ncbi:hypothetical protein C2S52_004084 [Perilla frutescens var. hirtella]|uniref:DUF7054 domain-containing protein n=1 Tax=Perilla frutescens var. hirtella TaxID=608512 RepID=A0AAD4IWA5_PERFH|nr:hypothetical protein C2S51_011466 [Perilla frutescens var. frutescens]KAH6793607.1 hypothetical protein C2S52_004084 [Perilla frutescens var. hirtella]KAH6822345.1 hypothetical protein C2S53_020727 [Perilla frutescens var. hirtella]
MPSPKSYRKGNQEKSRKGRSSYDLRGGWDAAEMLPRPRTVPELLSGRGSAEDVVALGTPPPRLTKLLLNVTIQRSLGAVRVVMPPEATAEDLIAAALRQYEKEARLPVLGSCDAAGFDLHYSQFSLESLDREEKLVSLGSRNFFLFPKKAEAATAESGGAAATSTARCSNEADCKGLPWLKFMEFSL